MKSLKDLKEIQCVMNILELNDDTIPFTVFNCNTCENKPTNICSYCFENCHQGGHNQSTRLISQSETFMKLTKCSCALNNHVVKNKSSLILRTKLSFDPNNMNYCNLHEILKHTSLKNIQREKSVNKVEHNEKYICLYCINFCENNLQKDFGTNLEENYENIPTENLKKDDIDIPQCKCHDVSNHYPFSENVRGLSNVIDSNIYNEEITIQHLPATIFNNKRFIEDYFQPMISFHKKLREKIILGDFSNINKEPLTKSYIFSISLLSSFRNCFGSDYYLIKSPELLNCFNFEFIKILFSTESYKNDSLLYVKSSCLKFFRGFYLGAKITFRSLEEFGMFENITPLHRLLFSCNLKSFFKSIDLNREEFLNLMHAIPAQIIQYEKHSSIKDILFEYLKLIKLLVGYYYDDEDFYIIKEIVKDLKQIMETLHDNASNDIEIRKHLEEIAYFIIINNNDRVFYKNLNLEFNRLQNTSNDNYSFQNGEMQDNLIHIIFSQSKFDNESSKCVQNEVIYDLLINKYDYYSESIRTLLDSNKRVLNQNLFLQKYILTDLDNLGNKTPSIIVSKQCVEIKNILQELNVLKIKFYDREMAEEEFLNVLTRILDIFGVQIRKFLYDENINEILIDENLKNEKQIILVKMNSLKIIFNLYQILKNNKFIEKYFLDKLNRAIENLFVVISLILDNNPFLISILFTNSTINLLLDNKDKLFLNFYQKSTKILKKYSFKLDFSFLFEFLIDTYNLKNLNLDTFTNNKADNNEKYISNIKDYYIILKIIRNCLQISNEKSMEKSNARISQILKNLISSQGFVEILKENFSEDLNHNDHNIKRKLILAIFDVVNSISNFIFNSLSKFINYREIVTILFTSKLDPKSRLIITTTFYRMFLYSPYFHKNIQDKTDLETFTEKIDDNLIGRINTEFSDEDLFNFESLFTSALELEDEVEQNEELDENMILLTKETKLSEYKLFGIIPLLFNHKKFKTLIMKEFKEVEAKKFNTENSKAESLSFLLKYFDLLIFQPTIHAIYKITYFFPTKLDENLNYIIYTLIHLFSKCHLYFIQLLRSNFDQEDKKLISSRDMGSKIKIVKRYFKGIKSLSNTNFFIYLDNLCENSSSVLKEIESIHSFDYNLMMEKFVKIISCYKPYLIIKNKNLEIHEKLNSKLNKKINDIQIEQTLRINLYSAHVSYIESKSNFTQNIFHKLFSLENNDILTKNIKSKIASDLIHRIGSKEENLFIDHTPNQHNSEILESLIKLFKIDPDLFQNKILNSSDECKVFIESMVHTLKFSFQYIFNEFTRLGGVENYTYENILNILEFLRLLCENQNKMFQTFLIKYVIFHNEVYYIQFYVMILRLNILIFHHINHFLEKRDSIKYLKNTNSFNCSYFDKIIIAVNNFCVESVQGTFEFNLDSIFQNCEFNNYLSIMNEIIKKNSSSYMHEYEALFVNGIKFLNTLMDEKNNSKANKTQILQSVDSQTLLTICEESFKKLVYEELLREAKAIDSNSCLSYKNCVRDGEAMSLLRNFEMRSYNYDTDRLFILSSQIFLYLKFINNLNILANDAGIIKDIEEMCRQDYLTENQNKLTADNLNEVICKREMFMFFSFFIRDVEISFKEKFDLTEAELEKYREFFPMQESVIDPFDNNLFENIKTRLFNNLDKEKSKDEIKRVIFIVHPISLYIKDIDVDKFIDSTYDDYKMRLNNVITFCEEDLILITDTRKEINKKPILNYLSKINFDQHIKVSFFLCLIINILLILGVSYSEAVEDTNYINNIVSNKYQGLINNISLANIVYITLLMTAYLSINLFRIIHLNNFDQTSSFVKLPKVLFSLISDSQMFPLLWSLTIGLMAFCNETLYFLYSLQLLAIFLVYSTMNAVIQSVILRYRQFLSAVLVIIIASLCFSSISFYFFKDEYSSDESEENSCSSLFACFVYVVNYGIRGQSLGFPMISINNSLYFYEFLVDRIFYIGMILIMLNVINGIIVDTFQQLREENATNYMRRNDVCYVCSIKRENFEKRGLSFEMHKSKDHNVLSYIHYIMKIISSENQDLNSVDYYVSNMMKQRRTDFFPIKKCLMLDNN